MAFTTLTFLVAIAAQAPSTLLLGDSLMRNGVAPALKEKLEQRFGGAVDNKAKSASGLSRPDFYDWPKTAAGLLKDGRYKTAIILIGANDCQSIKDAAGKNMAFDTPGWREAYTQRVKGMATLLCENGRKAYWLGLPPMQKAGFDKRIRRLEEIVIETLAASGSCVKHVPTREALSAGGMYAARLQVRKAHVKVREEDGIHISQAGGALVADALLKEMPEGGKMVK